MPVKHPYETFYVPLLFLVAGALVGFAFPELHIHLSPAAATTMNALAVLLIIIAAVLAYRALSRQPQPNAGGRGGKGGDATSIGYDNKVTGGQGGDANGGSGGAGGNATARGNRSVVKGGKGGAG